jgi:hypothetical protein
MANTIIAIPQNFIIIWYKFFIIRKKIFSKILKYKNNKDSGMLAKNFMNFEIFEKSGYEKVY